MVSACIEIWVPASSMKGPATNSWSLISNLTIVSTIGKAGEETSEISIVTFVAEPP